MKNSLKNAASSLRTGVACCRVDDIYQIHVGESEEEREVVRVVDVAVLHEAQVVVAYDARDTRRHLVGEEAALLSLVDELRQLNQAVRVTLQAAGHTQGGEGEQ